MMTSEQKKISVIFNPKDRHETSVEWIGGKAAHLMWLQENNFTVPAWFCLTTQAFKQYISTHETVTELMDASSKHRHELLQEIKNTPYNPKWRTELDKYITKSLDESVVRALVVRSSANVEDGVHAAYAGQFDTFLGVDQAAQVWENIKACWLSLFSDHAVEYTRSLNVAKDLAMAVVIQELIPADVSGVMFTANPLTQRINECVIESTWGLGEALVGGEVVPDQFIVNRGEDRLGRVQTKLGTKTKGFFWNNKSRKIEERKNTRYFQRQASLHEDQLEKLVRLGQQIESCYSRPQDIEWAIYQDQLYILQTRPITA